MNLIILFLDVASLTAIALWWYRRQSQDIKRYFFPALSIKILAGVAVGILYFYHYQLGDTIAYWQDGKKIADFIRSDWSMALSFFWDESEYIDFVTSLQQQAPRSLYFSKMSGLLALVTAGNYWMMSTMLSFASFVGSWHLFRRMCMAFPEHRMAAALAFLFFPSVILWSAGLIKESAGLASLYFLIATCVAILSGKRISLYEWAGFAFALWVGWNLKYYWLGIFIPVAVTTIAVVWLRQIQPSLIRFEIILWSGVFLLLLILATNVHPNFYLSRFLEVIYQSNLDFVHHSPPPRIVQYLNLEPSMVSMVMNAPAAWIAGLFRPFVWESFNLLSLMAGLENLVMLIVVVLAIPGLRNLRRSPHRLAILSVLVYSGLLVTFLALSTPNFGTLSRYKIGAIPLLLFVCLTGSPMLSRWLGKKQRLGED